MRHLLVHLHNNLPRISSTYLARDSSGLGQAQLTWDEFIHVWGHVAGGLDNPRWPLSQMSLWGVLRHVIYQNSQGLLMGRQVSRSSKQFSSLP